MRQRNIISILPFLGVLLAGSCARRATFDSASTVRAIFDAWQLRDAQTVRSLLSDDVRWEIMGQTYVGKDQVLAFMEFDAAQDSRVKLARTVASGESVLFELVESNRFMANLGVPEIRNYGRMEFRDGKVHRISETRPPGGAEPLTAASNMFFAWLQEKHPEAIAHLAASDGTPIVSAEAGKTLVALSSEWRSLRKK